jgi:hypothetical protein
LVVEGQKEGGRVEFYKQSCKNQNSEQITPGKCKKYVIVSDYLISPDKKALFTNLFLIQIRSAYFCSGSGFGSDQKFLILTDPDPVLDPHPQLLR